MNEKMTDLSINQRWNFVPIVCGINLRAICGFFYFFRERCVVLPGPDTWTYEWIFK